MAQKREATANVAWRRKTCLPLVRPGPRQPALTADSGGASRAAPGFERSRGQEFDADEDAIQKKEQGQREDEQGYPGEIVEQALDRIDPNVISSQDKRHDAEHVRQNGDRNDGQDQK